MLLNTGEAFVSHGLARGIAGLADYPEITEQLLNNGDPQTADIAYVNFANQHKVIPSRPFFALVDNHGYDAYALGSAKSVKQLCKQFIGTKHPDEVALLDGAYMRDNAPALQAERQAEKTFNAAVQAEQVWVEGEEGEPPSGWHQVIDREASGQLLVTDSEGNPDSVHFSRIKLGVEGDQAAIDAEQSQLQHTQVGQAPAA